MFDIKTSAIVTTEVQSRQYHTEIREALQDMERGQRALITLAEADGNDTDGLTLDIICVSRNLYNVQVCTLSMDSTPDGLIDLDGVIQAYSDTALGCEASNDQNDD